jgi:L-seryl-tRNA(Ser) seleniumtransferase
LARDRELVMIEAMGMVPLTDLSSAFELMQRSAQDSLSAGADLVILRGDGLVGGPACGLILGRQDLIEHVSRHPLCTAWQLDPLRMAAFAATLECHEGKPTGKMAVPIIELLTAPIDNLRNRAERLAPQLSQVADIRSAEVVATHSCLFPTQTHQEGMASYAVSLTSADGGIQALQHRLASASQPVIGRIEGDQLILDLRTVFPRQDQALVEAIVGANPADSDPEPSLA